MPSGSVEEAVLAGRAEIDRAAALRRGPRPARRRRGARDRDRDDVLDDALVRVDDPVAQRLREQLVLELAGHGAERRLVERPLAAEVHDEPGVLPVEQHVGAVEEHVRGGVQDVARVQADVERQRQGRRRGVQGFDLAWS